MPVCCGSVDMMSTYSDTMYAWRGCMLRSKQRDELDGAGIFAGGVVQCTRSDDELSHTHTPLDFICSLALAGAKNKIGIDLAFLHVSSLNMFLRENH